MSITITQTITPDHFRIPITAGLANYIENLFQNIFNSNIFPTEEADVLKKIHESLINDQPLEALLDGLCYLLVNFIRPKRLSHPDHEDTTLGLIDDVHQCLKNLLPPGTDIEDFLSKMEEEDSQVEELIALQNMLNTTFEQLVISTNISNDSLNKVYEEAREKFHLLLKQSQVGEEQIFQKIENQMKPLEKLIAKARKQVTHAEKIGERFAEENRTLKNIIKRG